jgi:hypothetical protein
VIGFSGIKDIAILYQKANSWTRLRFFSGSLFRLFSG